MKIASVADIKAHLSAYLKASAEGPVVVTRNGKAVAVLVAVGLLMAHSPRLL
jgi:prevent-host-death family protein